MLWTTRIDSGERSLYWAETFVFAMVIRDYTHPKNPTWYINARVPQGTFQKNATASTETGALQLVAQDEYVPGRHPRRRASFCDPGVSGLLAC